MKQQIHKLGKINRIVYYDIDGNEQEYNLNKFGVIDIVDNTSHGFYDVVSDGGNIHRIYDDKKSVKHVYFSELKEQQ